MDARRIGLWLVAGGAVAQVSGLGLDAWSHATGDVGPDGVLSVENAGHLLFVLGLVAVALGAVLALIGPRLYRPHPDAGPGLRLAQFGAPAVALLLVAGGMAGASSSSLTGAPAAGDDDPAHSHVDEVATPARCDLEANTAGYYREAVLAGVDLNGGTAGHGHDDTPSTPGIGDGEVAGAPSATTPEAEGHDDHDGPQTWIPVTDTEVCAQLDAELAQAADVAARYPTAADAQAAGYMKVTNYIPGIAAHWMNLRHVDETFAIDAPRDAALRRQRARRPDRGPELLPHRRSVHAPDRRVRRRQHRVPPPRRPLRQGRTGGGRRADLPRGLRREGWHQERRVAQLDVPRLGGARLREPVGCVLGQEPQVDRSARRAVGPGHAVQRVRHRLRRHARGARRAHPRGAGLTLLGLSAHPFGSAPSSGDHR